MKPNGHPHTSGWGYSRHIESPINKATIAKKSLAHFTPVVRIVQVAGRVGSQQRVWAPTAHSRLVVNMQAIHTVRTQTQTLYIHRLGL